ncbi:hypothetical protein [Neorhizobium sp. S3-V5DH]|uniref:hypothetical protein n=1 Tax=Neorhizobium sp. S3-V5DH TaxID=2485166 RepID=UPI001050B41A|nr:hypothetical protein [Neorhizobium sp. S3-V5DH]
MAENEKYVGNLVEAIIQSEEIEQQDWEEFSLVLVFEDDDINQAYGYSYDRSGEWEAIAVRPRLIRSEACDYREWLRQDDKKGVLKMLLQFNKANGKFNVDFEYENSVRWQVTPWNIDTIVDELRPKLGG